MEDTDLDRWFSKLPPWMLPAALITLIGLVFLADVLTPLGIDVSIAYLPLCAAVAWLGRPRTAVVVSLSVTALIVLGGFLSPPGAPVWLAIINRTIEIVALWLTVAAFIWLRNVVRVYERAQSSRDANKRLSDVLDGAEDAIITTDEHQNITLFNRGAERVFGYSAGEAIGRNLKLLLPTKVADTHQKFVDDFARSPQQARRMGERGAVAGRRKDGSEFPAEVSISKSVLADGTTYTAILRDITDRVKADQLLRDREQRLSMALEVGQMGVFQNNEAHGTIDLDATARKLLDWPPEETRIDSLLARIHPDDRDDVMARFERARRNGGSDSFEFRLRRQDGSYTWILSHGVLQIDSAGRPLRSVGILRDVTERKSVEQALEARVAERTALLKEEIERREEAQTALVRSQKLQAVGELAGGIAHDFNNLLTVITGNLELLGFRQLDDKARDHLRRADEAAKMGARLAGRLLAIGRNQRLQPVALDLNEIAKSMSDVLKRTLGDAISIETSFAANLWHATADISEVENAILNLAVNARDAMPHGGKLVIKTENTSLGPDDVVGEAGLKPGDYVLLSVADTGAGMPPEVLARVFEPYFTTKEAGRGTGLGLSTIYGFAKQVGGHLTIYSEIGKGTSVKLYLPRSGEAAAAETRAAASPQMQAEGETILVVEDNADVRDVTVKRLDMLGYRVLIAENAPRAIETLKAGSKIDLVFSDVMMPGGMSGFDLANWIRANRPEIKVLLTSGFTGEIARNGEKAAADIEVLRKPYATADLARAVRETLNP